MVGGAASTSGAERGSATDRGVEMREALERTLLELNEDAERGPVLRATGLRVRLVLTDIDLVVDLAAGDAPGSYLRWSLEGDADWEPRLELEMDAGTANDFLQQRISLPVAVSHRRARCRCDSRAVVAFLPAVHLIAEPYRRIVADEYPGLDAG